MQVNQLTIGGTDSERLAVEVRGYSYPGSTDADDGNWLNCKASVAVGGFRGSTECSLRAGDFSALARELARLLEEPRGIATFMTMEEQLSFRIEGDGLGHFEVRGELIDQPGIGNSLRWNIEVDQAQIATMLDQVRAIAESLPVKGV